MTANKLHEILESESKLTLQEVKEIIWELKNDCVGAGGEELSHFEAGYYSGEINMAYICLDLLSKMEE